MLTVLMPPQYNSSPPKLEVAPCVDVLL